MMQPSHLQILRPATECDCDFQRRLTMGGILRLVQEISTLHSEGLGATPLIHEKLHTAFLLAQQPIRSNEMVTLDTYPAAPVRAVYHRYTTLRRADGSLAAAVDARWVLVDTETRRILRRPPEGLGFSFDGAAIAAEQDFAFPKPTELRSLGAETAGYSRCDQNRHLNNTRYADIVCDHLPPEALEQDLLRRLVILYHRELPMGDSMDLLGGSPEADGFYFCGKHGEESCFEAYASFAPVTIPEPRL